MHAASVDPSLPVHVQDRSVPVPGEGEVLLRMLASGVCPMDVHAANGDWPRPSGAVVPGHEGVGVVEALGPGVTDLRPGFHVVVPWLGWSCGHCEWCVSGREHLCPSQRNPGLTVDGTDAEWTVASAGHVVRVPYGIDPVQAAALSCAGVTAYRAVRVADVHLRSLVAVFGVGSIGHLAVQYARLAGGRVIAIDSDDQHRVLADRFGARYVVDPSRAEETIRGLGGAEVAIVTDADPDTVLAAFRSLRRGGHLVIAGLPAPEVVGLPIFETVLGGITVTGSVAGTRTDLADVLALHAEGHTEVIVREHRLADIATAFAEVRDDPLSPSVVIRLAEYN